MKAKLEVEMPEGCYDCQFCAGTECGVAEGMPTIDLFGEEGLRPKWCPLIPEEITRSRRDWYLKGYNDAKKERDWIPVSEQLPEEQKFYLVTIAKNTGEHDIEYCFYECGKWLMIADGNSEENTCWEEEVKKVVAWMPLPEPYKPE